MAWYDVGKQVVCVKRGEWVRRDMNTGSALGPVRFPRPKYGEVCTIEVFRTSPTGLHIKCANYRGWMNLRRFRPVQKSNRSTETGMCILKEIAARKREPEGVEA